MGAFTSSVIGTPSYSHVVFPDIGRSPRAAIDRASAASRPSAVPAATLDPDAAAFMRVLLARLGLDAALYRPETLARRLPACLRALGARGLDEAYARLGTVPGATTRATDAVLIGVTGFFRDASTFDALEALLPPRGRPLRVWSAGCSTGAELYSVAMLLAASGRLGDTFLLGTDCRPSALARARAGVFDEATVEAIPGPLRARYLVRAAAHWTVVPALRSATHWWTADALGEPAPGVWDVILCRNLAIYLCASTAERLWTRLAATLRGGGLLVVGRAERPSAAGLTLVAPGIHRRGFPGR